MDIKKTTRFVLNEKIQLNSNVFYYLSLIAIAIITFYPLFKAGLASADDMGNYTNTRFGKELINSKYISEFSGRFYYLIVGMFHNLAYEIDDLFITKLFHVVPICLCLFLFYKIVIILTRSKEMASLYVLLFFIIAQFSHHTSLFLTYPFYFTFAFSLILSAYLLLFRFQTTGKKRFLIFSALLFGFGLLFYEVFILFLVFASMAVIYDNFKKGNRGLTFLKQIIFQILPYVFVVICYGTAYVLYSRYHPSEYSGTQMAGSKFSVATFFQVLWSLSYTAFPLTEYISSHTFFLYKSELIEGYRNVVPYLFYNAHVEWIIKSALVFVLGYYMLLRIPRVPFATIVAGFLFSVMFTFFPHIPLALTQKYIYYVTTQEMHGYITTFFSLFGVLLFLATLSTLLVNYTKSYTLPRHAVALIISAGFVICSFLTDFTNYYVAQDVHQANVRMRVVDVLIKSEEFKNIPSSSNIYSAQLWDNHYYMAGGLTEQGFQWNYYILCKSGMLQNMIRDEKEFLKVTKTSPDPGYRIIYKQGYKSDDALLAIGQLGHPDAADTMVSSVSGRVLVVFYSKYKQFSVSYKQVAGAGSEKTRIKVNHLTEDIDPGNNVEFTIFNTKFNQPATIFTIESGSIDIRSIQISNLINPASKVFYL